MGQQVHNKVLVLGSKLVQHDVEHDVLSFEHIVPFAWVHSKDLAHSKVLELEHNRFAREQEHSKELVLEHNKVLGLALGSKELAQGSKIAQVQGSKISAQTDVCEELLLHSK